MASGQGELALCLDFDSNTQHLSIEACAPLPTDTRQEDLAAAYFSLCDLESLPFHNSFLSEISLDHPSASNAPLQYKRTCTIQNAQTPLAVYVGKKYKPVAMKV